jgi:hypothetical protein
MTTAQMLQKKIETKITKEIDKHVSQIALSKPTKMDKALEQMSKIKEA